MDVRQERVLRRSHRAGALALLLLTGLSARLDAQGRLTPRLSVEGFGTLGVIYSTERSADYVETSSRPAGPGFTKRIDGNVDSRVAGQATLQLGSKLSAVVQLMVEQTASNDYAPHAEWANLSYAFTPDVRVRVGRIVMPAFLVSDARKVSYANPWIRPPVELYGMGPLYSLDGVDGTVSGHVGEWTATVNAAYGHTQSEFPRGTIEAERLWNTNLTVYRGAFSGRVAVTGAVMRTDMFAPLFDGFRAFGPAGAAIADEFDVQDGTLRLATAGADFNPGHWFAMGELGWLESNSAIGERVAGYVTAGVRWRRLTPYATIARAGRLSRGAVTGLDTAALPPAYAAAAAQLNAGLNDLLSSAARQQTVAIGARWDALPNIALKAQLDLVDLLDGSKGTFVNQQPGFETGGSARLFSLATAFVF